MTKELENTCEMIIRKHKEREGTLTWHKNVFEKTSNTTSARNILIQLGYISWVDTLKRTTVLTQKGWLFESFEDERQKPNPEIEKLQLELTVLRNQVFDYESTKKQALVALWLSAIAVIAAILQLFIK